MESAEQTPDAGEDGQLLDLARAGDRRAFADLWRRHAPAALGYARRLGPAPPDAEDVVADAFLSILKLLRAGKGPEGQLRPYLFVAVRNARLNALRRSTPLTPFDDANPIPSTIGVVDIDAMADSEAIMEAFRSLPPRSQHALWLNEVEELPPRRIAEVLGISPNSVAALTYRSREALRKAWIQAQLRRAPEGSEHARTINALGARARGSLSRAATTRVERHLEACPSCAAAAAEATRLNRTLTVGPLLAAGAPLVIAPALFGADRSEADAAGHEPAAASHTDDFPGAGGGGGGSANGSLPWMLFAATTVGVLVLTGAILIGIFGSPTTPPLIAADSASRFVDGAVRPLVPLRPVPAALVAPVESKAADAPTDQERDSVPSSDAPADESPQLAAAPVVTQASTATSDIVDPLDAETVVHEGHLPPMLSGTAPVTTAIVFTGSGVDLVAMPAEEEWPPPLNLLPAGSCTSNVAAVAAAVAHDVIVVAD